MCTYLAGRERRDNERTCIATCARCLYSSRRSKNVRMLGSASVMRISLGALTAAQTRHAAGCTSNPGVAYLQLEHAHTSNETPLHTAHKERHTAAQSKRGKGTADTPRNPPYSIHGEHTHAHTSTSNTHTHSLLAHTHAVTQSLSHGCHPRTHCCLSLACTLISLPLLSHVVPLTDSLTHAPLSYHSLTHSLEQQVHLVGCLPRQPEGPDVFQAHRPVNNRQVLGLNTTGQRGKQGGTSGEGGAGRALLLLAGVAAMLLLLAAAQV